MQVNICGERRIDDRKKSAEIEIASYLAGKEKENPVEKKKAIQKRYAFCEIIENIKKANISFFVIQRKKKTQEKKDIFAEIIITKGALKEFKMRTTLLESQYHPYEKYIYIYAVERPAAYDTTDGIVIVSEQICVKSKFKKQFVPVEKKVEEWLRKSVFFSDTEGFPSLNPKAMLVIILLDCLLEKEVFEESDKLFIENNRDLLDDLEIRQLLKNELFSYTDELVQNIKNADYNAALKRYISYAKY